MGWTELTEKRLSFCFRYYSLCSNFIPTISVNRNTRLFFLKNLNIINQELRWAEWIWYITIWIVEEISVFHVKVEKITMCRCVDFVDAFAVMIALHYIFNVTYTKKIEATMICVQRLLLETHDNQKIPPKVLSLICKIKKDNVWKWDTHKN